MRNWMGLGFAAAVLMLAGCGGGKGKVVAKVGSDAITETELVEYLKDKPRVLVRTGQHGQEASLPVVEPLGFQAMRDMIIQRTVFQMAADEGVAPTDKDIVDEIEFQKKLDPNFIKRLTAQGLTLGQIKEQVRYSLSEHRLVTKGITVSDQELDKFIADNPRLYIEPAQVALRWILARSPATREAVDRDLARAKDFKIVALQFSEDPNVRASDAGFPETVVSQLSPELRAAVEAARDGQTTGWLEAGEGAKAKFFIERKTVEKKRDMTPELREATRRQLQFEHGSKARDLQQRIQDRILQSRIDIVSNDYKGRWEEFLKDVQRQKNLPKATSAANENR